MAKKTKTFRRYCVIKRCPYDFGLGVGVVGVDEVTYTDERNQGFKTGSFDIAKIEGAEDMLKEYCTVLMEPKIKGRKWNTNPMKIAKDKIKVLTLDEKTAKV
jgi:hypothetical protein